LQRGDASFSSSGTVVFVAMPRVRSYASVRSSRRPWTLFVVLVPLCAVARVVVPVRVFLLPLVKRQSNVTLPSLYVRPSLERREAVGLLLPANLLLIPLSSGGSSRRRRRRRRRCSRNSSIGHRGRGHCLCFTFCSFSKRCLIRDLTLFNSQVAANAQHTGELRAIDQTTNSSTK